MKRLAIIVATAAVLAACGTATPKAEAATAKKDGKTIELTSAEFKTKVADYTSADWKYLGDKPAIVDFYATWCGPCKQLSPVLAELAAQYDGQVVIYKIDIDKQPEVAAAFGVQSIPTLLFIPAGGGLPQIQQGAMPKDALVKVIDTELLNK